MIHPLERLDLVFLLAESAHDADSGEILLYPRGDVAEIVLHRFEADVNLLAEDLHQRGNDRERNERHEGHHPIDARHHDERAGDDEQ